MNNHVPLKHVIVMAIVISVVLLFLGFGVLLLIHICIVGNTLGRGTGENDVNMVERGSLGSTSMSRDDIEKLPCFDFEGKAKGSSPPGDCAVCLENFQVGEKCRLLPSCNHSFHAECVDLWLLRASVCPICRAGAECADCGSMYGGESNSFDENGGENSLVNGTDVDQIGEVQEEGESGNFDSNIGDELGLNQTVEIIVSSRNSSAQSEILV